MKTETGRPPSTRERELAPLRMIRDNYEKVIIAASCDDPVTHDGIKILRLTAFFQLFSFTYSKSVAEKPGKT